MLTRLSIRDIVLIERLDIDFASGLAVLTGETGAGKSILLDAFALALGARGDASLVRQGAEQGQVTACFDVRADHPVRTLLAANEIAPEAGEETSLADRRAAMMQAEKAADDLRSAHEAVAGSGSPVPVLAAAVRRLERRHAQAPTLIEPAVKAIDAALTALADAQG